MISEVMQKISTFSLVFHIHRIFIYSTMNFCLWITGKEFPIQNSRWINEASRVLRIKFVSQLLLILRRFNSLSDDPMNSNLLRIKQRIWWICLKMTSLKQKVVGFIRQLSAPSVPEDRAAENFIQNYLKGYVSISIILNRLRVFNFDVLAAKRLPEMNQIFYTEEVLMNYLDVPSEIYTIVYCVPWQDQMVASPLSTSRRSICRPVIRIFTLLTIKRVRKVVSL